MAEEYIANVVNLASEQRVEHLQKIQNAYSKCKEFSDDKVQLAMQTYEMVSAIHKPYAHSSINYHFFQWVLYILLRDFMTVEVGITFFGLFN